MSDIEPFEISEDDQMPQKRKRQSKEEALYGVFYTQPPEETEIDASKPVNFASGTSLNSVPERISHKTNPVRKDEQLPAKALEEMYGKGFKMLQKAGFKVGQGLGKHEQGAVAPLQIQTRRKNEGLHIEKNLRKTEELGQETSEKKWKKGYQRPLLSRGTTGELEGLMSQYKAEMRERVTDMTEETGPRVRSLTDIGQWKPTSLQAAWARCRQEVLEVERQIRYHQDVLVAVAYENTQTKQHISRLETRISQIQDLSKYVTDRLDLPFDLSVLLQFFINVSQQFPDLWQDLDSLRRIAVPMAAKGFETAWQRWNVATDFSLLKEEAGGWAKWLGEASSPLFQEWERSLQRFLQTRWKPREETGGLIDALEGWKGVIPRDVLDRVKSCVLDVLRSELDHWEPTRDQVPVHTWLHPWLPLLDLTDLWPGLLQKLGRALKDWKPVDQSAFVVLTPWKPVLGELWNAFSLRFILPKLAFALKEIDINPKNQEIDTFLRVMDWADFVPEERFAEILKTDFYPKWRETLEKWLLHIDETRLPEVQTWYEGWQSLVPKHLIDFSEAFHSP